MPAPSVAYGSFEELAMPLFGQLYNFACWLAGNRAAAEDLVQETYLKAFRAFSSFQQGTNFRAWIYRILRNTFLTSQSGLKAVSSLDDEEDAPAEPAAADTPESILLVRDQQDRIRAALEALPVHHREIILLCDLEEMSYQEISQAMAIPMGTVMSRLSRARRAMRALLTADRPSDKDPSPGTSRADHPSDEDLSPGTPRADHPSDEDLSPGTPRPQEGRAR